MIPISLVHAAQDLRRQSGRVIGDVEGDDLAPVFRIEVEDIPILEDIKQYIKGVEFESCLEMTDLFKLVIDNPGVLDDLTPDWAAHKAFQPGNEASLFVGYGGADRPEHFVGRAQWAKHLPVYPTEGMATLEVKGYDISHKMMDNSGPVFNAAKIAKLHISRPVDSNDDQGQVAANALHSEIVSDVASMYGMIEDIDDTTKLDDVVIKKGMKHFELVKALANLNNRDFWVDYDNKRRNWTLHWKKPNRNQQPGYVFRYNHTQGTLLSAEPEYGLREQISTATILIFDGENQRWVSAIEVQDASGPSPIFRHGGGLDQRSTASATNEVARQQKRPKAEARRQSLIAAEKNVINEALDNAAAFRIAAGGVAIDVLPPGRRFKDPEEAARYLLKWFTDRQDNFIVVQGKTIGVQQLRARQVHTLSGLGKWLDGDFYFTKVRHVVNDSGYVCEYTANKVISS